MNKHLFMPIFVSALFLFGCVPVYVQGSGNVITETRDVSGFERVEVCCGMQLVLTQGNQEQLTLEADDNVVPEIETIVRGETLTVRFRPDFRAFGIQTSRAIMVYLTMPTIRGVVISGGGSLETERIASDQVILTFSGGSRGRVGTLETETAEFSASGGSQLTIDHITTERLDVEASGGGGVTIEAGSAAELDATVSGGSYYRAAEVESETARLELSGGADARIWVTEALDIQASGGSELEYSGNPTIDQELSGGSELNSVE